jgi:hypothetical protein
MNSSNDSTRYSYAAGRNFRRARQRHRTLSGPATLLRQRARLARYPEYRQGPQIKFVQEKFPIQAKDLRNGLHIAECSISEIFEKSELLNPEDKSQIAAEVIDELTQLTKKANYLLGR